MMHFPAESLERLLLDIICLGIMRIRVYANRGQSEKCLVEAYHIHNLPSLVVDPTLGRLIYYYDIERTEFVEGAGETQEFELLWAKLKTIIESRRSA